MRVDDVCSHSPSLAKIGSDQITIAAGWRQSGESALGGFGDTGAAYDQPDGAGIGAAAGGVGRFRDLGFATSGVGDIGPGIVVDAGNRPADVMGPAAPARVANSG